MISSDQVRERADAPANFARQAPALRGIDLLYSGVRGRPRDARHAGTAIVAVPSSTCEYRGPGVAVRFFWVAIALVLVSTTGARAQSRCFGASYGVAPPQADADYRRKYDTLAHRLLDDEAPTGQVTPQMYALLDSLIDQARGALKPYPAAPSAKDSIAYGRDALSTINCILLANGFVWRKTEIVLLSDALRLTHHGAYDELLERDPKKNEFIKGRKSRDYYFVDCDTGAYVYMAIAETMHLPLSFVTVPGHAFVRWTADAQHRFDFETTNATGYSALGDIDWFYVRHFKFLPADRSRRHALSDMTRDQTIAFHHVFVAQTLRSLQADKAAPDFAPMLQEYDSVIRYDPGLDWPYNEIAWFHAVMQPSPETKELALRYALRAEEISDEPASRDTLACVYAMLGDFEKAARTEIRSEESLDTITTETGRRAIRKDADDIAHRRPCTETVKDYTTSGAP